MGNKTLLIVHIPNISPLASFLFPLSLPRHLKSRRRSTIHFMECHFLFVSLSFSLSEAYIRSLARDQQWVKDGPRSGVDTGYDLKKPMAVLLQAMLERIDHIETQLSGR